MSAKKRLEANAVKNICELGFTRQDTLHSQPNWQTLIHEHKQSADLEYYEKKICGLLLANKKTFLTDQQLCSELQIVIQT